LPTSTNVITILQWLLIINIFPSDILLAHCMSKADEIIQELSKSMRELKCFVQVAEKYSRYVETDLSNFEIVKLKYAFKNKKSISNKKSPKSFKRQDSKNRELRKSTDNP
jgi:hypothetical protein